jgi:hypothetical protein
MPIIVVLTLVCFFIVSLAQYSLTRWKDWSWLTFTIKLIEELSIFSIEQ